MRKTPFRRGLPWAFAAMLAVALSGVSSASAATSAQMLGSQLPAGVSLARASVPQTANALKAAVAQRPDMAESLTKAAVLARTPRQGQGELSCDNLNKIVSGGVNGAPAKSRQIVETALSLHPECSDSLNALLTEPNASNAPNGFDTPGDLYGGFGVGFGPGFPGSPGFTGSPPSGAIALPPGLTPVTNTTNG